MSWTRILSLIIKELLATFRDPRARVALMAPPFVQLILFAYAATMDVTHVPVGVLNQDWGLASTELVSRLERASAFSEIRIYQSQSEVRDAIDAQDVMVVIEIDQDFSRKLARHETPAVQVLLDGRKSNSAQIVSAYVSTIVADFARDYFGPGAPAAPSEVVNRTWYNPNRDFRPMMAPSLLASLTMLTVMIVVSMSVARERELGTLEQLLVSPLQPLEIIIGKAAPGLMVGMTQGTVIALIVVYLFGIPITGSVVVLFASLAVFLCSVIGIALFISSLVANQQQAMMGNMVFLDAGDHAVGLHLAGAEHARLAAAVRDVQSAHPLPRHRARRIPTRDAVRSGAAAIVADGDHGGRYDVSGELAVPKKDAVRTSLTPQRSRKSTLYGINPRKGPENQVTPRNWVRLAKLANNTIKFCIRQMR